MAREVPDLEERKQNLVSKIATEILSSDITLIKEFFFKEERGDNKTLETSMQEGHHHNDEVKD